MEYPHRWTIYKVINFESCIIELLTNGGNKQTTQESTYIK